MKRTKQDIGRANYTLRDYVKQYKNSELCEKWSNNIPASELQGSEFQFLRDYELKELCNQFSFLPYDDITSALVSISDGDYGEVYVTEYSRPYALDAIYHPLDYYL